MRKNWLWVSLALMLSACPMQQPPQANATPEGTSYSLQGMASDIQGVMAEIEAALRGILPQSVSPGLSDFSVLKVLPKLDLQSLLSLKPQGFFPLATQDLPRGKIECVGGSCQLAGPSEDLEVSFKNQASEPWNFLLADWNSSRKPPSSPTVFAHSPQNTSDTQEVPTKAFFTLDLGKNGSNEGEATLSAQWRQSACLSGKYLLEPVSLNLEGFLNHPNTTGRLVDLRKLRFASSNTRLSLEWELGLVTQGNNSGLFTKGLVGINGSATPGSCGSLLERFDASTGDLDVELSTRNHSMRIAFGVTQVEENPTRIHIQNGYLRVDNKVVTFAGILDDQNGNCVPGENLTLTFAGGRTMSLEAYLTQYMQASPCR